MPEESVSEAELVDRVLSVVSNAQGIPLESLSIDTDLEKLGLDSLDAMNLAFALEETFDVELADEELREITSIRHIVDLLRMPAPGPEAEIEKAG